MTRKVFWTYEKCEEMAKTCETIGEFRKRYGGAYKAVYVNKWQNIFISFKQLIKPKNYWNKENCNLEASKYINRSSFKKNCKSAYESALKNKWLDDICKHMIGYKKIKERKKNNHIKGYWNKERCQAEALKYDIRNEFHLNSGSAYTSALLNGWLNDICKHMKTIGHLHKRSVYMYNFPDNHVYIGLSYNLEKRKYEHATSNKSPVFKHIEKTGLFPIFSIISDYVDVNKSREIEVDSIKKYRQVGFILLNKNSGGGIGGNNGTTWTYENCKKEVLEFVYLNDFRNKKIRVYNAIHKNKWYDLLSHLINTNIPKHYWNNKNNCFEESKKYNDIKDFRKYSSGAYRQSRINNWLNEFFPIY